MEIAAISDMHGILDFTIKPCDILCVCGDIVPLKVQSYHDGTFKWLRNKFIPWCNEQPCDKVFLIAGNHDLMAEEHPDEWRKTFNGTKIVYLCDEGVEYVNKDFEAITIYGTPWCHQFYDWAFMTSDVKLSEIYSKIPYKVDLLLTHDAPHGVSDVILDDVPYNTHTHIGCIPLAEAVEQRKPMLHLHGHLHSTNHEEEKLGDTRVYNVSVVNEAYKLTFEPLYIKI